jgi:hypothetical protein
MIQLAQQGGAIVPSDTVDTIRIWVRLPSEKYKQFEQWSKQIGLPMSNLVALCAWTGAQTVIPTLNPDARKSLQMLVDQEEADYYAELSEIAHEEEARNWREWSVNRDEFLAWKKERDVQSNQQNSQG